MNEKDDSLVRDLHRQAFERDGCPQLPSLESVPFSELPESAPGDELAQEWNAYRSAVPGLLADGLEGKFVVIKGDTILGIFDTWDTAREQGFERGLVEPFLVHRIQTAEKKVWRVRGYSVPWQR